MSRISRRQLGIRLAATAGAALTGQGFAVAQGRANVVIVGGGIGGATVAHYLKKGSPGLEVTLVEPSERITTCAGSNLFLGGIRTFEDLTHDYDGLRRLGVKVVRDRANAVDTAKRSVVLASGGKLSYDRLVVSPGIDFKYAVIEGYSEAVAEAVPHAWSGGRQSLVLKRQIEDMADGGLVVIAAPPAPYRCPPAPYERACMIAYYLKTHKPKSKLLLLDAKSEFVKEAHFVKAFGTLYPGLIELHKTNPIDNMQVVKVDPKARQVVTKGGQKFDAAVINLIPPQKAGALAFAAGLTEADWCPVEPSTFASRKAQGVFVLGDSTDAGPMPKSAFATNSQAKLVVNALEADLLGKPKFPARLRNTCWSLLSRGNTVKVGASYTVKGQQIEVVNSFVSPEDEPALVRARNTSEYLGWYTNMTTDSFGKAG